MDHIGIDVHKKERQVSVHDLDPGCRARALPLPVTTPGRSRGAWRAGGLSLEPCLLGVVEARNRGARGS